MNNELSEWGFRSMGKEHKAWVEMFEEMTKVLNLSEKELNNKKYRKMFEMIERWSYYDRLRREEQTEEDREKYPYGVFWNGEKE